MKVFDTVRVKPPRRNKFDLSHERKMSIDMGTLIPVLCEEVLPGENWRVKSDIFLRFMALLSPVMHRVDVTTHFFWVPNRLIWKDFPDFITQGESGTEAPVPPKFRITNVNGIDPNAMRSGSLLDYLGFPVMDNGGVLNAYYNNHTFSVLPLRAYQLIYDQYYRDQNVQESIVEEVDANPDKFADSGEVSVATLQVLLSLRKRAWEKDYLTSCLPWAQRGNAVSVPMSSTVTYRKPSLVRKASDNSLASAAGLDANLSGELSSSVDGDLYLDNIQSLAGNFTINALRQSARLQEWLEKNARGGGRYIEQLASHFGVVSSDARLQRVQYLGGGKQPVVISEVLQTAPGDAPVANMAGHAMSVGGSNVFSQYFEEHGFVMGIMSVTPRTSYQQGYAKKWSRVSLTDYFFPEFANLGEQAVYGGEAYYNLTDGSPAAQSAFTSVFGYQSRYAEYKYIQSWVSGYMRDSLAFWHFGRKFAAGSPPALNEAFIACTPRLDPFAVTEGPLAEGGPVHNMIVQIYHRIDALRPIPYHSTPSL